MAVTLADVKAHLNITSNTSDGELQSMLDAALDACERYSRRPLVARTETDEFVFPTGNGRFLTLTRAGVANVTEVLEAGEPVDSSRYVVMKSAGVLSRTDGLWRFPVSVTYTTTGAYGELPSVRLAVLELVRHLWRTQRGSMPMLPRESEVSAGWDPAQAYSLPNRVTQLLAQVRVPA